MMVEIFLFLTLLQVKHFICDWVYQSEDEVKHKEIYLHPLGIAHSAQHGLGTFIVSLRFFPPHVGVVLAVIDFLSHYHIDWVKQNLGLTMQSKWFWTAIGADQMLHQLMYIAITYYAFKP